MAKQNKRKVDRFTLDTCGWPLIINDEKDETAIVATFPLPANSNGEDKAATEQVKRANAVVRMLNSFAGVL